ncbi:MAG: glycoside hydrolase family 15 protein [Steroidobacteraceae bacterium]
MSGHSEAPGAPGLSPTWCSSDKEMVGCSLGPSRLWFTIGGGILNEVYHPRIDIPQIRDLGIIVGDGKGFWVEVKRMYRHTLALAGPGVPAVRIVHRHERFELALRIAPSRERDVLLMELELTGDESLRPYALLAPHLGGTGTNNRASIGGQRGNRVLCAEQGPYALALGAVTPAQEDAWERASCGCVGASDGWQDFARNGAMSWEYASAGPGNVALMGELPRKAVLALGFASSTEAAATLALSALFEPFEDSWRQQIDDWTAWIGECEARAAHTNGLSGECLAQFALSRMVLRAHRDKTFIGAMVASLSVPWGNTKEEREGYHLVWPRDLCECASALLAVGATREPLNTLRYLRATQRADGHWNQNQWLGGKPYWTGVQLDETAFPVLLAAQLEERDALDGLEVGDMIRRALSFIVSHGPASDQDRWEEDAGINTFTLAACIAALVCGAPHLEPGARELALAIADYWNGSLEDWTVVTNTPLTRAQGLPGYYVRVAPRETVTDHGALARVLPVKNQAVDPALPASAQIGVDFLQLVRFGLRSADDPLIAATVRLADTLLKVDTPSGPCWHRYNDDGYGEHDDGSAFDGTGKGRAWPLLAGERGHYELAGGRDPLPLLLAMVRMGSSGGMLPEQVWDAAPVPSRGLRPGRPTGSAMPLAWAHAEYIKLVVSRSLGRPFDRPERVWERYAGRRPRLERIVWCAHAPAGELPEGAALTLAVTAPATFRWGFDGWTDVCERGTTATALGLHIVEIDTRRLKSGRSIELTYRLEPSGQWAGRDFRIVVVPAAGEAVEPALAGAARA